MTTGALKSRRKLTIISILYVILTGLLVGTALGILMSPDKESLLNGRLLGAVIVGVFVGISLGVIFSLRSSSVMSREVQCSKTGLEDARIKPEQLSARGGRPPLV